MGGIDIKMLGFWVKIVQHVTVLDCQNRRSVDTVFDPYTRPYFSSTNRHVLKYIHHPFFVHSSFRISSISWNPISFFIRDISFSNYSFPHQIGPTTFTSVCVCMCVLCSSTINSQRPSSLSVLKMKNIWWWDEYKSLA